MPTSLFLLGNQIELYTTIQSLRPHLENMLNLKKSIVGNGYSQGLGPRLTHIIGHLLEPNNKPNQILKTKCHNT